jgi:hypothetical protein
MTQFLKLPGDRRLEILGERNRRPIEDPAQLAADNLRSVLAFWEALRGDRLAPTVAEYDLLELAPFLPRCAIFEFIKGTEVIKVIFEGVTLSELYGNNHQKVVVDWTAEGPRAIAEILQFVIQSRCPVVSGPSLSSVPGKNHVASQAVFLPLSEDGNTITHVAAYTEFFTDREIESSTPRT